MPYWDTTFYEQEHNSCASLSPLLYIRPVLARDRESATPAMLFPPRKVFEDFTWNCSIVCVQRYQNAKTPLERTMKQIAWSYCSNVQTVPHVPTMSIHKDHISLVPLSKDPSRYNQVTRCKQLSTSVMEKS